MVGKCILIPKIIRPFPESWRKLSDYDRIKLSRSNKQNWACSLTLLKRNCSPYGWNIVCSEDQKCCLMPPVQIRSLFWTVCIITFLNWNTFRPLYRRLCITFSDVKLALQKISHTHTQNTYSLWYITHIFQIDHWLHTYTYQNICEHAYLHAWNKDRDYTFFKSRIVSKRHLLTTHIGEELFCYHFVDCYSKITTGNVTGLYKFKMFAHGYSKGIFVTITTVTVKEIVLVLFTPYKYVSMYPKYAYP